jgi:5-dehydro-2-deoxygluconokinase
MGRGASGSGGDDVSDLPDLVCVGRIGVDLYPTTAGPFATAEHFDRSLGGTATNVSVGAARLGARSAIVTKVGDDTPGAWCIEALRGFGVDTRWVGTATTAPTPVVVAELDPPDSPTIHFHRTERAPDLQLTPADLPDELVQGARIFWMTGTGLSVDPSRTTTLDALTRRGRREHTIFDLDWRPMLWSQPEEAPGWYAKALAHSTIAIGGMAECAVATGEVDSPERAAERLHELGVEIAVVKMGADGVLVSHDGHVTAIPPIPVEVVCGLGAGDAFGGAFCASLLRGVSPEDAVRAGNAAGAIVASRLACADAMPTRDELDATMEEGTVGSR